MKLFSYEITAPYTIWGISMLLVLFLGFFGVSWIVDFIISTLKLDFIAGGEQKNQDLERFIVACSAGALGAFVRFAIHLPEDAEQYLLERRSHILFRIQIFIGIVIGLFSWFLLQTRFILQMLYKDLPDTSNLTLHGVAIVAGLAGLLARELVGKVAERFTQLEEKANTDASASSGDTTDRDH